MLVYAVYLALFIHALDEAIEGIGRRTSVPPPVSLVVGSHREFLLEPPLSLGLNFRFFTKAELSRFH